MGRTKTFTSMPLDDPDYAKKVALVVDCSGHEAAIRDACNIVRQNGEVVLVGVPWRPMTDILAHEILSAVFFNYVSLRSGWEWQLPITGRGFVWEKLLEGYNNAPQSIMSGFEKALKWLDDGLVKTAGLMSVQTAMDPTSLYADIANRKIAEPFIVLDWRASA
jgi:threonine dehydrogenase-like Zn-dependent dehydrogenase